MSHFRESRGYRQAMATEIAAARVTLSIDQGIAQVALNRPQQLNGLDLELLKELVRTAKKLKRDKSVRAVILSGEGDAFCAGLDFASAAKQPAAMALGFLKVPRLQRLNLYQRSCFIWRDLPVPVIAALHGYCYGGGLQLALGCDFRIATASCELSVMEAKWGLIPDMSGSVSLRELLPIDVAKRLTMSAEVFSGERAKELGLVTEVADDPQAAALELARELTKRSPDALAATKKLFHESWTASERKAFWVESREQIKLLRSKNHQLARKTGGAPDAWRERGS
jgi:enoyl-CoA hydratase/carnithine racemase